MANTTRQQSSIVQANVFLAVLLSIKVKAAKTSTIMLNVVRVVLKVIFDFIIIVCLLLLTYNLCASINYVLYTIKSLFYLRVLQFILRNWENVYPINAAKPITHLKKCAMANALAIEQLQKLAKKQLQKTPFAVL